MVATNDTLNGTHDITLATRFLGISVRAMATVFGKIEEFDSSQEDWPQYMERLGYFFDANGIESAEKKRAVLLTLFGAATYKLLRNLVAPSKPGEKTYQELIQALTVHFSSTPSPIVCRFKFHSRCRQPGESIAGFVSQLRSLSENCGFGDTLEDMLRDRLVCGICDDAIQKRLLVGDTSPGRTWSQLRKGCTARTVNGDSCKECKGATAALRDTYYVNRFPWSVISDPTQTRDKDSPYLPSLWQDWP